MRICYYHFIVMRQYIDGVCILMIMDEKVEIGYLAVEL